MVTNAANFADSLRHTGVPHHRSRSSAGYARQRSMALHALVVTNMDPSPEHPALGSFVRDQVAALRRIDDLEVEVFEFAPGGAGAYPRAAAELRRRHHG